MLEEFALPPVYRGAPHPGSVCVTIDLLLSGRRDLKLFRPCAGLIGPAPILIERYDALAALLQVSPVRGSHHGLPLNHAFIAGD